MSFLEHKEGTIQVDVEFGEVGVWMSRDNNDLSKSHVSLSQRGEGGVCLDTQKALVIAKLIIAMFEE